MSHIFLSYASADRERARQIADLLTEFGWKVWWDRTIPPGRQFDEVIEEALDGAACVVVLWSKASISSTWVKTEAAEANRRKVLIPVQIEKVKIPLEFRRVQAADLAAWNGERSSPEVDKLVAAIEGELPRSGSAPPAEGTPIRVTREPPPISPPPPPPPSTSSRSEPAETPPAPEPQPPRRSLEKPVAPASSGLSAGLKWGAAGAVVALLAGGLFWNQSSEQSRLRELQVERQRQELERKLAEERRTAEAERVRQEKEAAEQANRERAVRDQLARERAARDAAERDAAARRRTADEAAARERTRQAEEASARRPVEAAAPKGSTTAASSTSSAVLGWRDHALTYSGQVTVEGNTATLRAAINDLNTGQLIGRYTVPARVSSRGQNEYFIQAEFAIPGDSQTPYPHSHQVGLIVRQQPDGSLRVVQNCPAPGRCY